MPTNQSLPTSERLTEYALGELDELEMVAVEKLISESPELQRELHELRHLMERLESELAREPLPSLLPAQQQAVLTAARPPEDTASESPAPESGAPFQRRRFRRWAIVGAEVAAAAAAVVWMIQTGVSPRSELSTAEPSPAAARIKLQSTSGSTPVDGYTRMMSHPGETREVAAPRGDVTKASQSKSPTPHPAATQESALQSPVPLFRRPQNPTAPESEVHWRFDASRGSQLGLITASPHPADRVMGELYEQVAESKYRSPDQEPLSTFSIDVDTASYSNVRRFLTQGQWPPADAVRIEEMVNYFSYDYPQPPADEPFSILADVAACPWTRGNYLARVALRARRIEKSERPATNLVFLLDVSGSMQASNKLPLVKQAMLMLVEELGPRDRIAIVTYAGDAGLKLPATSGADQSRIMQAIDGLQAGGSTNGAAGIQLAYEQAVQSFNGEGENRVILCTDGDFNVGISDDNQLVALIQQQARSRVFLSVFGFGMGNLKDSKLEKLADNGNGHYGYIDSLAEARRVFHEEISGTLYTVAKDVKIQVEFNPQTVRSYRLIGYENRVLANRDFDDDTRDAGEIGAGHTVTALYEIVPQGAAPTPGSPELKYAVPREPQPARPAKGRLAPDVADDLMTVKVRYKLPTADTSVKTHESVVNAPEDAAVTPTGDFMWASTVAAFGMQLKQSPMKGQWTLADVLEAAQGARGDDPTGRRAEFVDLIQAARRLTPQNPE